MKRFRYTHQPFWRNEWAFEHQGTMDSRDFEEVRLWCIERFGFGLEGKNETVELFANSQRTIYMFADEKAAMEFRLRWC